MTQEQLGSMLSDVSGLWLDENRQQIFFSDFSQKYVSIKSLALKFIEICSTVS